MKFLKTKNLKKLAKVTKSKKVIGTLIALILIFIMLATRGGASREKIQIATVVQKELTVETSASGKIVSTNEVHLRFPTAGKITWTNQEGNFVYKGQAIASLDKEKFEIALRQTQQDLNAADAVLSQVYDDLKKFPPPENFDQKIKRTNAETAKNKAFDAVKKAEKDLRDATLVAPFSGTLAVLNIVTGEEISSATEIGTIANLNKLQFIAQVDETEIAKINLGQQSTITLDAFEGKDIETTITAIAPMATTTSTSATAFEVKFNLDSAQNIRLGMNGEVKVVIESIENALVIPLEAIVEDKFVWVKTDGTYQKIEIAKGLESETEVQVTQGPQKNEKVLISGFDQIGKKSLIQRIIGFLR